MNDMSLEQAVNSFGAQMRCFDVELIFDRARPLTPVSAATFRGVLGWAAARAAPEVLDQWLKSGSGDHAPAAFALRQLDPPTGQTASAAFRVVTFAAPEVFPVRLVEVIEHEFPGQSFGEGETRILQVRLTPPCPPAPFPGPARTGMSLTVDFTSPFRLKRMRRIVGVREMSLAFLVSGAVERFNQLGGAFAALEPVPVDPLIAAAALTFERRRSLFWAQWSRISSTQTAPVQLDGCMGKMVCDEVNPALRPLLAWASAVNVGRHTSAGNGAFTCSFGENAS